VRVVKKKSIVETYKEAVPAKARTMLEIAVIASALEEGERVNE